MGFSKKQFKKITFLVFTLLFLVLPHGVHAAMLSIIPDSGTYVVGQTFTAKVSVSSFSQAMNATSGTLLYPADSLSVVSVSTNGSVISNWLPPGTNKPTYTPGSGSIHFEGIVLGGYKGAPTTVFTVYFKVLKNGVAPLSFQKSTILANDGKGTNIALAFGKANYKLALAPNAPIVGQVKPTTPTKNPPVATAPQVPVITSTPAPIETVTVSEPVLVPGSQGIPVSYFVWILIILSVLVVLIIILIIRMMYLTSLVRQMQTAKKTSPRKKSIMVSLPKKSPKFKVTSSVIKV